MCLNAYGLASIEISFKFLNPLPIPSNKAFSQVNYKTYTNWAHFLAWSLMVPLLMRNGIVFKNDS